MAKTLFTHVLDILSNTPGFQSEYGTILRHLLEIREYRLQMRKRTYSSEFSTNLIILKCLVLSWIWSVWWYAGVGYLLNIMFLQGLVLLYIEWAEAGFCGKNNVQHSQKEEAFRYILALQSLLENPPGDFPDDLREEIVNGLIHIFSSVRSDFICYPMSHSDSTPM